jgi:4-amino-4-deoxy-L-arabinose transferase-like glycosyltransferase
MVPAAEESRRPIRPGACVIFFLLFALIVFASHLSFVGLPYYWDEVGQFIPAALDILHGGAWIPHSTVPNIHPPAVMAYLAAAWRLAGYQPAVTRCAMLLLASFALLAAFLLAAELLRDSGRGRSLLAAALLFVSPLFFAQALLAQLDAPAMLFSTLAFLFFLEERIRLSVAACVALVMVKETGIVVPLVLAAWLGHERRWRDAAVYLAPVLVLSAWIAVLALRTGYWLGNADFARYNLYDPLHPVRLVATLLRRLYFLCFANFHWLGAAAVMFAWRRSPVFQARVWRVAGLLVAAHVVAFTLLGGAVLERYLLPAMPILYAAMVTGLSALGRVPRVVGSLVLLAGLAAGNFINPPYPFTLEDNLAFTDYLRLHTAAADYLERLHPGVRVDTMWPLTAELSHPEFGFVKRGLGVRLVPNLAAQTLGSIDWRTVQVLVTFSRDVPLSGFLQRFVAYVPAATHGEVRGRVPFPIAAQFERHGQWVDVYVNPQYVNPELRGAGAVR